MGAQKKRLNEMVLLSTHYICFGLRSKNENFLLTTLNRRPVYGEVYISFTVANPYLSFQVSGGIKGNSGLQN